MSVLIGDTNANVLSPTSATTQSGKRHSRISGRVNASGSITAANQMVNFKSACLCPEAAVRDGIRLCLTVSVTHPCRRRQFPLELSRQDVNANGSINAGRTSGSIKQAPHCLDRHPFAHLTRVTGLPVSGNRVRSPALIIGCQSKRKEELLNLPLGMVC